MATWSGKRKFAYGLFVVVVILLIVGTIAFNLFYEKPSCSDGLKNGDEQGIDCGGSCVKVCQSNFFAAPPASWVRYKEVAPNVYNLAAYVVNPNKSASAKNVPYTFSILDKNGFQIAESKGTFNLPAGRNTLIFKPAVTVKEQIPARVIVNFIQTPEWNIDTDDLRGISVADKNYTENTSGSSLEARLRNTTAVAFDRVVAYAILKDKDGNVINFSKTIVDQIPAMGSAIAPFTWPVSHNGQVISIEVLAVPE